VKALQCFLRKGDLYNGRVHGRYHQGTVKAVKRLQRRTDTLSVTGKANRKTWTALLARGSDPLVKYGSRAGSVRRLQRALNGGRRPAYPADGEAVPEGPRPAADRRGHRGDVGPAAAGPALKERLNYTRVIQEFLAESWIRLRIL
jgi:hypothetical protein